MTLLLAPTAAEIELQLESLLGRNPNARILGVRSPTRRAWPEVLMRRDRRFKVAWCESELEIRDHLDEAEENGEDGIVLITPLDASALGSDVLARLPRARLEETDRWSALRAMFRARDIDPRLRGQRWLADLLIERAPAQGYLPVAASVLDLDTVWQTLRERLLGLPDGRADLPALLRWTLDGEGLERLAALPEAARQKVAEHLAEISGAAGALVIGTIMAGRGGDALAIGLASGVVFGEGMPGADLREAAVRLEPFVGGARVAPEAGMPLAGAARSILGGLDPADPAASKAETRANAILAEIRADRYVALSPALAAGLEARMREAAAAISTAAASGQVGDARGAWQLAQRVAEHDRAGEQRERVERLLTAARLCRWLSIPARTPSAISEVTASYASDGSFVDRARDAVRAGDALPELASAYARLEELASGRRQEGNRRFAALLREWNTAGGAGDEPMPIEHVLERIVAPLAREAPVLVLVLDGLSLPLWRELAEKLARQGWVQLAMRNGSAEQVAAAALPSVTEVSRASLLCGRLTAGDQGVEKAGFATHAALVSVSRAGMPPRLFHKGDLGAGPELSQAAKDALADPHQRVVGVIHNAVDAELSGSDQLNRAWSADALRQLIPLLRVCHDTGRLVVVTADHGHVVEAGTSQKAGAPGDRWRIAGAGGVEEGEIRLAGGRVIAPDGSRAVIAAWSERIRYAGRRAGYHGGASPQEVLVPVAVLASGEPPRGFDVAPPAEPFWWRDPAEQDLEAASSAPPTLREMRPSENLGRRRARDPRQPELFAEAPARVAGPLPAPVPRADTAKLLPPAAWIDDVIGSELYAAQRRLAARGAPADDQVRAMLQALAARGGRLSGGSLAQAIAMPALRIGGLVNAARRVLNVDQAQVLVFEGGDVVLDERLLRTQFGLTRAP